MEAKDIELLNFDLLVQDGDFACSASDTTHIEHLLLHNQGNLKSSPISGIGIFKKLNSSNSINSIAQFKSKVYTQLEFDGYINPSIDLSEGIENIKIDAKRV